MKEREILNHTYMTLHEEKKQICEYLQENGLSYTVGYFPYHTFKEADAFYREEYPIPVIQVVQTIDIGIDIDKVFFEFNIAKEAAIDFDFHIFENYQFEVYGSEDYLEDYYFGNIDEIKQNILYSTEIEFAVSILITKDNFLEQSIEIIDILRNII